MSNLINRLISTVEDDRPVSDDEDVYSVDYICRKFRLKASSLDRDLSINNLDDETLFIIPFIEGYVPAFKIKTLKGETMLVCIRDLKNPKYSLYNESWFSIHSVVKNMDEVLKTKSHEFCSKQSLGLPLYSKGIAPLTRHDFDKKYHYIFDNEEYTIEK